MIKLYELDASVKLLQVPVESKIQVKLRENVRVVLSPIQFPYKLIKVEPGTSSVLWKSEGSSEEDLFRPRKRNLNTSKRKRVFYDTDSEDEIPPKVKTKPKIENFIRIKKEPVESVMNLLAPTTNEAKKVFKKDDESTSEAEEN